MKSAFVSGAGGFIGSHLVRHLKREGFWVRGVDLKFPEFSESEADDFVLGDLRDPAFCAAMIDRRFDEVYQLAADMGGAGYIFIGENDADIMHNSATINLNVLEAVRRRNIRRIFYSSSACMYPAHNQEDPDRPNCAEDSAYPAAPDSANMAGRSCSASGSIWPISAIMASPFAWRIIYYNIFGPEGTWTGGKEKAPAALCRKIASAPGGGEIEIWGDGRQTRSFLYIDECVEGTIRLMRSDFSGPVNIGSEEMVTINGLAHMIMRIAEKDLSLHNNPGPTGVRGRNSDNRLIREHLGWAPSRALADGLAMTYRWIERQVLRNAA